MLTSRLLSSLLVITTMLITVQVIVNLSASSVIDWSCLTYIYQGIDRGLVMVSSEGLVLSEAITGYLSSLLRG